MQEIFNKVEQNQLQRTKNVVYFLDAGKYTFDFQNISNRAEMSCGTPPTGKFRGWTIVSYMPKGQWLILCCWEA